MQAVLKPSYDIEELFWDLSLVGTQTLGAKHRLEKYKSFGPDAKTQLSPSRFCFSVAPLKLFVVVLQLVFCVVLLRLFVRLELWLRF